jgi:hypothetical protein
MEKLSKNVLGVFLGSIMFTVTMQTRKGSYLRVYLYSF